jgi:hypothetical protein
MDELLAKKVGGLRVPQLGQSNTTCSFVCLNILDARHKALTVQSLEAGNVNVDDLRIWLES